VNLITVFIRWISSLRIVVNYSVLLVQFLMNVCLHVFILQPFCSFNCYYFNLCSVTKCWSPVRYDVNMYLLWGPCESVSGKCHANLFIFRSQLIGCCSQTQQHYTKTADKNPSLTSRLRSLSVEWSNLSKLHKTGVILHLRLAHIVLVVMA